MKKKTAIKIAIECIEYKAKLYNFDAALFRLGMTDYIAGAKADKKLKRLETAISILQEPKQQYEMELE